ncbi:MAG: DUF4358 domain-containing protein [Clostridiales bacterium]|nr:DUF4358 domain-containing protein [Clostridiales bacterium]
MEKFIKNFAWFTRNYLKNFAWFTRNYLRAALAAVLLIALSAGCAGNGGQPSVTSETVTGAADAVVPTADVTEPSDPATEPSDPAVELPEAPADEPPSSGGLGGTSAEALDALLAKAKEMLAEPDQMPASLPGAVTGENSKSALGVEPEDFDRLVEDAAAATAMITTFAHEIAVVKAKDASAAQELKSLIAQGFDYAKWICAYPEECVVVESGRYVMLAASKFAAAEISVEAFQKIAGEAGEKNIFYIDAVGGGVEY